MKSILQNIVLLSSILLVASCDSGRNGGVGDIGVTLPTPSNGIMGTAAKGVISGATITVTNASGANIALKSGGTTGASGQYSLVFTEAAIAAGITAPLTVTITGGTSVCDLDVAGTDNDCSKGDGTFAKFGASYALPAGFSMKGIIASIPADTPTSDPVVLVNVTPASDIAASLALASAAGSALTAAEVNAANQQVLGLIQTITGIDMSGFDLIDVPIVNVAALDAAAAAAPNASYALMAFAAAMIAEINLTDTDTTNDSLGAVIANIKAQLSVDASGNLKATGTNLGRIASSVAKALATVNQQLAAAGTTRSVVSNAQGNATSNAAVFTALASAEVSVPNPPQPGDTTSLDKTKAFVTKLSNLISSAVASTGVAGFGGPTYLGATEVFATQLDSIARINSGPATHAFKQLSTAIKEAADLATDSNVTDTDATDGVTGTIAKSADGKTITITNAVSTYTDASTGVTVTITIPTGTGMHKTSLTATGVTMVTTQTEGATTTTLETFTGDLAMSYTEAAGLKSFSLDGKIVAGTPTTSFGVVLAVTDLAGFTSPNSPGAGITGNYNVTITFASATADDLAINFHGAIRASVQSFTATAGASTLMGTVTRTGTNDVDVLTDGTTYLTLTLNLAQVPGVLTSGVFTVGTGQAAVQTGTVNSDGVITYSDGSIQALPAAVF